MTLLEKAKEARAEPQQIFVSDEVVELALAWAKGEISMKQARKAFGTKTAGSNIYAHLARGLRQFIQRNAK